MQHNDPYTFAPGASAPTLHLVPDSFQAFLVEQANFTKTEEYPILQPDMIFNGVPDKIIPFQKAWNLRHQADLSNTFVCFYSPDSEFERVRRNPAQFVPFFKSTAGIIGFDFSIHQDMPIIKQKSQMNDNLSLTYYFASKGIPIIPNLRCGVEEVSDEFFSTIPQKSTVAIGTHGFFKHEEEKCEWFCFLEKVIDQLKPARVIVYGSLKSPLFDPLKQKTQFHCFTPWISERWKQQELNYGD